MCGMNHQLLYQALMTLPELKLPSLTLSAFILSERNDVN